MAPSEGEIPLPRILLADQEHLGIRIILPILTIAGLIGFYRLGTVLVEYLPLEPAIGTVCVALPGTLLATVALVVVADKLLKRLWPSGRKIVVGERELRFQRRGKDDVVMDWDRRINVTSWRFTVDRRSRVPRGWQCLACQLIQDEAVVSFYTFMSASAAEKLPYLDAFHRLLKRSQLIKSGRPADLLLAGEQGRLRGAESYRWDHGLELTPDDFVYLVGVIAERVESWPGRR